MTATMTPLQLLIQHYDATDDAGKRLIEREALYARNTPLYATSPVAMQNARVPMSTRAPAIADGAGRTL